MIWRPSNERAGRGVGRAILFGGVRDGQEDEFELGDDRLPPTLAVGMAWTAEQVYDAAVADPGALVPVARWDRDHYDPERGRWVYVLARPGRRRVESPNTPNDSPGGTDA